MAFVSEPVGLQNGVKNVCFFNSDLQLLFSILGQNSANPVATYPYILQLGLPGYKRGTQFDAQEYLSHIINLFLSVVHDRENYQYLSCLREGNIQVQDSIS